MRRDNNETELRMIEIMNLRKDHPRYPYDVKVDRSSPLGNHPFPMHSESDRDKVCDLYRKRLYTILDGEYSANSKRVVEELKRLKALYKKYKKLRLWCWCSPKRCHAESIREVLIERYYNFLLEN